MYVYIKSEPGLWTVGFYRPNGQWEPESDHGSKEDAAGRVAYLNGNKGYDDAVKQLAEYGKKSVLLAIEYAIQELKKKEAKGE